MHLRLTIHLPIPSPHTIAFDSSHKHLTTHSISWHRPLSSIVALLEHASMRAARYLLVLMIALEAPQLSRVRLVGPGCCRTTGGGLRAWDEPSTAAAIAAKRVHDFPMNHTACAAHCAALKGCTHFELNMYDQPVHSNKGVCSVFASGGFSVTAGCKGGSDRPRMRCFAAWTNRTRRAGLEIPACECRSTQCLSRHCCSDPNAFASGHRVIDGTECGREHALPSVGEMAETQHNGTVFPWACSLSQVSLTAGLVVPLDETWSVAKRACKMPPPPCLKDNRGGKRPVRPLAFKRVLVSYAYYNPARSSKPQHLQCASNFRFLLDELLPLDPSAVSWWCPSSDLHRGRCPTMS